ncbi:hypothetical protein ALC62_06893 [Cyphomyrmex costatus]|uniref:HAT C-terminal dimerisation domain-containing protein n=1 Tax=Cyphomyrmex costatus TaxID=456900 RepID=A0A151IIB6_9HYME|nr:hypothetical protein ALC62_06893 [Cyphomyrmex costatus]
MFFKGWLKACIGDNAKAFCAYCKTEFIAHRKSIKEHACTKKHLANINKEKEVIHTPKIDKFVKPSISGKRKRAELKIAAYIAEHCSVNAVDHLGKVIGDLDPESEILSKIKLHRTKCTGLIVNVLSPCMLHDLIDDVNHSYFSLIIDESTLIDTTKVMCVMIRYFSKKFRKTRTTFYRLIQLENGTAEHMITCFINQLNEDGLNIDKLVGIGVDGANSMIGPHNSLSSRVLALVPHLIVVQCLCHSLHLAAENACSSLPRHIDYLIETSHSWFSTSAKKTNEFADLFKTINQRMPKKIPKLSGTRWLARFEAITIIIDQWDEYKLHFEMAKTKYRGSAGYKAEELYNIFRNNENKLYLIFLRDALKDVIRVNKLFQSSSIEPFKLFADLNTLMYSALQKIVVPAQLHKVKNQDLTKYDFKNYTMATDCINFGYYFNELCGKLQSNQNEIINIKNRCKEFLIKLAEELQKRIPKNMQILEKISAFSPQNAKNETKIDDITAIVVAFERILSDIDTTLNEWSLIHRAEINADTSDEFWRAINLIVDSAGQKRFSNISKLALALLTVPFSNASVERAFSIVNIVKDKLRNKLEVKTIDAILRVRFLMENKCDNFEPTPLMLKKFVSEVVYTGDISDEALNIMEHCDKILNSNMEEL